METKAHLMLHPLKEVTVRGPCLWWSILCSEGALQPQRREGFQDEADQEMRVSGKAYGEGALPAEFLNISRRRQMEIEEGRRWPVVSPGAA